MLITLVKDEYLPSIVSLRQDDEFQRFVSKLGEILAAGHHVVHAGVALLQELEEWPGLSRRQTVAFRKMQAVTIAGEIPFHAVTDTLVLTGPAGAASDPVDSPRRHRRPWRWLVDSYDTGCTLLGAENSTDAEWFEWLGRAWGVRLRPGPANAGEEVKFRTRGFGGGTSAKEARMELVNNRAILLCILDSDRDEPEGPIGGTARDVDKELKKLGSDPYLWHQEVLQARDVENLLPAALVERLNGAAWVQPLLRRGFFVRRDEPIDPTTQRPRSWPLRYLDLGKNQCARMLTEGGSEKVLRLRRAALQYIRERAITTGEPDPAVEERSPRPCMTILAIPESPDPPCVRKEAVKGLRVRTVLRARKAETIRPSTPPHRTWKFPHEPGVNLLSCLRS
jgi:hypothetical protein